MAQEKEKDLNKIGGNGEYGESTSESNQLKSKKDSLESNSSSSSSSGGVINKMPSFLKPSSLSASANLMFSSTLRPTTTTTTTKTPAVASEINKKPFLLKPSSLSITADNAAFYPRPTTTSNESNTITTTSTSTALKESIISVTPTSIDENSSTIKPSSLSSNLVVATTVFGEDLSEKVHAPIKDTQSSTTENNSIQSSPTSSINIIITPAKDSIAAVQVSSGEENERHILQLSCKALMYDAATSQWIHRGPCYIRLNDLNPPSVKKSRLILRTSGNMRVLFNTYITNEMLLVLEGERCVRVSALELNSSATTTTSEDNSNSSSCASPRVFSLVFSSSIDAKKMYGALSERKITAAAAATTTSTAAVAAASSTVKNSTTAGIKRQNQYNNSEIEEDDNHENESKRRKSLSNDEEEEADEDDDNEEERRLH